MVRLDGVAGDELVCYHRLDPHRPVLGGLLPELVEDVQVHAILQATEVLRPAQPLGDLLGADEEAREEQLRHEDGGGRLLRHLRIRRQAPHEQGHGSGGHPGDPEDQHEQDEAPVQAHQEVSAHPGDHCVEKALWQLHHALGQKVGHGPVGLGRILPEKDAAVQGKFQQQRLSRPEHPADRHVRHATKVGKWIIVGFGDVAHLIEDQREEHVEDQGHQYRGHQTCLVAPHVLELPLAQCHELHAKPRRGSLQLRRHGALVMGQS
mmetsp:Transcript_117450/g.278867  ORF Transcript_117450/g.278867 Transcript_117450/m.278867 type:complete len:264 (+) Transcript_117450:326-1117(+)